MKWIFLFLALIIPGLAFGQSYNAMTYTAGSFNPTGCNQSGGVCSTDLLTLSATLPNGTITYCKDCHEDLLCSPGGNGAIAAYVNNSWNCVFGVPPAGTGSYTNLTSQNFSTTNIKAGPGSVSIVGGSNNGTDAITNVNVNGVLNAATFPGADIGAKVNNAIMALPTKTEGIGPFQGYIAGTTLTVTGLAGGGGGVDVGADLTPTPGVAAGTIITARGTGTGAEGTYTVNLFQTVGSAAAPIQMTGQAKYAWGTVYIPPTTPTNTIQQFATPIGLPPGQMTMPPLSLVSLVCDHGTELQYTGTGPDWINMQDPYATNGEHAGGVFNCGFVAPANPVPNQDVIHIGDQIGFQFIGLYIEGMGAPGDSAIKFENRVYFTENFIVNDTHLVSNETGLEFVGNCQSPNHDGNCGPSMMHGKLHFYCSTSYSNNINACIYVHGGVGVQNTNLDMNFNLAGTNANTSVVRVDGAHPTMPNDPVPSAFYQNVGTIVGESDVFASGAQSGRMWYMTNGGYAGEWNDVHGGCGGCVDSPTGYGTDSIWSSGVTPMGSMLGNTYLSDFFPVTQAWGGVIFSCRNVTGGPGSCTTPPVVEIENSGGAQFAAVQCPSQIGRNDTTAFTWSTIYPGEGLYMLISSGPTGCTNVYFDATLHYRTN